MVNADNKYALIVAGGKGLRMHKPLPKQFIEINKLPILMHTIYAFAKIGSIKIIVVLPKEQFTFWKELCIKHNFLVEHQLAEGGETRFDSVKNGLTRIVEPNALVAVHDGVRPLIDKTIINLSFNEAQQNGNAITAVKLKDSIREVNLLGVNKNVNRNNYFLMQTPQTFDAQKLKVAYQFADHFNFTDDASVFENHGHKINLIEGSYRNIKITTEEDLLIAEALLKKI